jgi:hypothetical protein
VAGSDAIAFARGQVDILAVIDRLDKARLQQPALQEGAAPSRNRQVHHIGHHIDTGHQPARKAEAARHRVVMHLVFGLFRRVVGGDPVGLHGAGHVASVI